MKKPSMTRPTRRAALAGGLALGAALVAAGALAPMIRAAAREATHPPLGRLVRVAAGPDAEPGPPRVNLHLHESGPADGPVVALIHGASGNLRDMLFGLAPRLADVGFRVVALDRPGFGYSERGPADAHRPDVQARLLRRALEALGIARAVLIGHSFGATPALAWALDRPASVIGVVDVGGPTVPWPGPAGRFYEAAATPWLGALVAGAAAAAIGVERATAELPRFFAPQSPPEGYAAFVGVGLALRPATLRANAEDIARLKPFLATQSTRYPGLSRPVEILHGTADTIVPAALHAQGLAAAAPDVRLTLLEGVGHMAHHAAAEAVVAAAQRLRARAT